MGRPALKIEAHGATRPGGRTKAGVEESQKTLRVGLIEGGRIIEEHIVPRGASVTVGDSERNTFSIPTTVVPSRFVLFERHSSGYRLAFTEEMRGRVATNGETSDLADVKGSGATRRGRSWLLPLPETARGRVVIGEYTFLFQFVALPPAQPRPRLPASVRRKWSQSVDWPYAAILAVSAVLQAGFIIALVTHDWPAVRGFQPVPDRIRYILAQAPPSQQQIDRLRETLAADRARADEEGAPEASSPTLPPVATRRRPATPSSGAGSAQDDGAAAVERRARLREGLAAAAQAQILTALGGTGPAFDDVLRGGSPDTDFDALMAQVNGVKIARAGSGTILRRPATGDGIPAAASMKNLRPRLEAGTVSTGEAGPERAPRGRVGTQAPRPGPSKGFLSGEEVRRVVRQRLGGIKACYERALPRNPSLAGRLVISFTVGGGGRVLSVRTSESSLDAPQVSSCVERQFRLMRFSEPQGGNAAFSFPFVFRPMQ